MSHILSHDTHMNASRHTYECIPPQIKVSVQPYTGIHKNRNTNTHLYTYVQKKNHTSNNRIRTHVNTQLVKSPCVFVCCSVLQCVAVCCSALQCVAVRCSALQCVTVRCSALQCVAVRCSVQCVAVHCSALQYASTREISRDQRGWGCEHTND